MATFRKALPTPAGEPEARQTPRAVPGWIVLAGVGLLYLAMAAFVMIRRYVLVPDSIGTLAALVGGALFGFSPYMAAHALGHPPAVILFTAPLMLLVFDDLFVRQTRRPTRSGVVLGVLAAV